MRVSRSSGRGTSGRFLARWWLLCCVIGALFISTRAFGVPAAPIVVTLSQPDGTTFEAICRGDEHTARMETLQGHTIVQKSGEWFYAVKGRDGSLQASRSSVGSLSRGRLNQLPKHVSPQAASSLYEPSAPRSLEVGPLAPMGAVQQPMLVIIVNFSDISTMYTDASFQNLFYGATASVKDFYLETTYNQLTVAPATESQGTADDGVVSVNVGYPHPNFGGSIGASAKALVADAIKNS